MTVLNASVTRVECRFAVPLWQGTFRTGGLVFGFGVPCVAETRVLKAHNTQILAFAVRRVCVEIARAMSQTHPLTTTAFELPGYRVVKSFGVVRGIVVRSRSILGNIGAHIQTLFGGHISLYSELCERARSDAYNLMLAHAGELGANAVIGVRYDATEIAPGVTEVLCYGTAVFVEPATE